MTIKVLYVVGRYTPFATCITVFYRMCTLRTVPALTINILLDLAPGVSMGVWRVTKFVSQCTHHNC